VRPRLHADGHAWWAAWVTVRRLLQPGPLLLALAGWTAAVGLGRDATGTARSLLLLCLAGAAWQVGRRLSRSAAPVLLTTAGAVAVLLVSSPGAIGGAAGAPPLGYANANAALAILATGAVLVAAVRGAPRWWPLIAAATAVLALLTRSRAGAVALALLLVVAALARTRLDQRLLRALAVTPAVLASVATLTVATRSTSAVDDLDPTRAQLWREAWDATVASPLTGAGPGRLPEVSPLAGSDTDVQWAHSLLLQQSAETGLVGAALLVALLAVVLRRGHVLPVATVGALLLQASVDYTASYPVITTGAALLLGMQFPADGEPAPDGKE
jgi:O-antigen ligase